MAGARQHAGEASAARAAAGAGGCTAAPGVPGDGGRCRASGPQALRAGAAPNHHSARLHPSRGPSRHRGTCAPGQQSPPPPGTRSQAWHQGSAAPTSAPGCTGIRPLLCTRMGPLLHPHRPLAPAAPQATVFAVYDEGKDLQYVGFSKDLRSSLRTVFSRRPDKAFYFRCAGRRPIGCCLPAPRPVSCSPAARRCCFPHWASGSFPLKQPWVMDAAGVVKLGRQHCARGHPCLRRPAAAAPTPAAAAGLDGSPTPLLLTL